MTVVSVQNITLSFTKESETFTLELPDWPGGALSLTYAPETGTVLTTKGNFTHVVDGDYTLVVSGRHTTMVGKSSLFRTGGHAVTFANKTIQLNPLSYGLIDFIIQSEQKISHLLRSLIPSLNTPEIVKQKQAKQINKIE